MDEKLASKGPSMKHNLDTTCILFLRHFSRLSKKSELNMYYIDILYDEATAVVLIENLMNNFHVESFSPVMSGNTTDILEVNLTWSKF